MTLLKLTQRELHFTIDDETHVKLRVIEPSEEYGAWPGNNCQVREWQIVHSPKAIYVRCTDDQVRVFEKELGEINDFTFVHHPSLGRVATPLELT